MPDATGQQKVERKLAAIVAADIAGYSRLMGADEVGTLQVLKSHRKALIDPMIAAHHGRIVKTTGDGMLVEFASVVDAVTCSVAIQRGMINRNADVPEDKRIVFRVGINLGDIIVDRADIYGDGVNVAARLEALCEPGGLCISRAANDQIRDKLSLAFADLGEQTVKNIARAVGVYGLTAKDIAALPEEPAIESSEAAEAGPAKGMMATLRRPPLLLALAAIVLIALGSGIWWLNAGRVGQPGQVDSSSISAQKTTPEPATKSAATATPAALSDTARSVAQTNAAPRLSVVALPFINLSSDPEQEYFVDSPHRRSDYGFVTHHGKLCHRAEYRVHLQGQVGRCEADRARSRCALYARRKRPANWSASTDQCTAH
jgi:adenylate cyclase